MKTIELLLINIHLLTFGLFPNIIICAAASINAFFYAYVYVYF